MNCFHFGNKIIWRYFYYFFNTYASPPCDGDWMLGSKVRGHSLLHRVTEYREVKDLSVLKAQFTQTEERTFVMTVRWTVPLNSDCTRKRSHRWNYDTSFYGSVSSRGAHPPPWEPLLYLNGVLPKKKKKKKPVVKTFLFVIIGRRQLCDQFFLFLLKHLFLPTLWSEDSQKVFKN